MALLGRTGSHAQGTGPRGWSGVVAAVAFLLVTVVGASTPHWMPNTFFSPKDSFEASVQHEAARLEKDSEWQKLKDIIETYETKLSELNDKLSNNRIGKHANLLHEIHSTIRPDPEGDSGHTGEFDSATSFIELQPEEAKTYWPCACGQTECECDTVCDDCAFTPGQQLTNPQPNNVKARTKEDFSGPFARMAAQSLSQGAAGATRPARVWVHSPVQVDAEADYDDVPDTPKFAKDEDGWGQGIDEDASFPPLPFDQDAAGGYIVSKSRLPVSATDTVFLQFAPTGGKKEEGKNEQVSVKVDPIPDDAADPNSASFHTFECKGCKNVCTCESECECALPNPDKTRCDQKLVAMAKNRCEPGLKCMWSAPLTFWAGFCTALYECPTCAINARPGLPDWVQSLAWLCKLVCQCKHQCLGDNRSEYFNEGL